MLESKKKANAKYLKSLDAITARFERGYKDRVQSAAEAAGMSLNSYVRAALDAAMSRDNPAPHAPPPPPPRDVRLALDEPTARAVLDSLARALGDG